MKPFHYDILDDLEPLQNNSVKQIIKKSDESNYDNICTNDFYHKLRECNCTFLFLLTIDYKRWLDIRKIRDVLTAARNRFYGECGAPVISVAIFPTIDNYEYLSSPINGLGHQITIDNDLPLAAKQDYVEFKIPIRIGGKMKNSVHRCVWNTLNFLATIYSIMSKYNDMPPGHDCITYHRLIYEAPQSIFSEYGYAFSTFNTLSTGDVFTHKFHSESEYEYDHNPNKCQSNKGGHLLEMTNFLNIGKKFTYKKIETEFNKWWKKYQKISPTPYNGAGILEIINAE